MPMEIELCQRPLHPQKVETPHPYSVIGDRAVPEAPPHPETPHPYSVIGDRAVPEAPPPPETPHPFGVSGLEPKRIRQGQQQASKPQRNV